MQGATSSSTELVSSSEPEKTQLDKILSEMRIKKIEDQIFQILQKVIFFCDCTVSFFFKITNKISLSDNKKIAEPD